MLHLAPEYVSCVLNENFEDAKALFLEPLMAVHYAHLVMLAECGIISPADARAIRNGLDAIDVSAVRKAVYDGTYEDLFFYIERLLVDACGPDVAGRLHTARSRNDIDMTMYRMRQRQYIVSVVQASLTLREALIGVADVHRDTVLALHTHTIPLSSRHCSPQIPTVCAVQVSAFRMAMDWLARVVPAALSPPSIGVISANTISRGARYVPT